MYVVIVDQLGAVLSSRELDPDEIMSANSFADAHVGSDYTRPERSTDQNGDFRVIFCEDPGNLTRVWNAVAYYYSEED